MMSFLYSIFPNLERGLSELITCTMQTLQMSFIAGLVSFILGIFFGTILIVTCKNGILENKLIYNFLDKLINVIRSIPFLILIVMLIPLTRKIVGTSIGVKGAVVPLIIGTTPFFSRQIETALSEVDGGLIEASQSMGFSPLQIIISVYLRESIPAISRGSMITFVNLVGLTAMAGAVGGGGLGDFALRYGYQLNMTDLMWITIFIILLIISIIQAVGNFIVKKSSH